MHLRVALEVFRLDICDGPFVNISRRNYAVFNQAAQEVRRSGINLVVVGRHASALSSHFTRGSEIGTQRIS
jgi:hypothetical protein